tara:strand:+ start:192 stop:404 length:213 start_codon:yes stop_codon:yes gene_type:complete
MFIRAIMLIDLDVPDFTGAAKAEQMLRRKLEEIKEENKEVSFAAIDCKERRGNAKPDISQMAFRQNKPKN